MTTSHTLTQQPLIDRRRRQPPSREMLAAVALVATVLGAMIIAPHAAAKVFGDNPVAEDDGNQGGEEQRIREGTQVEKIAGHFKLTGDRVTFITADGKQRFGGLENLALERIARIVKDSPAQLRWTVAGVMTEYRGANYLLVTHAVLADDSKGNNPR